MSFVLRYLVILVILLVVAAAAGAAYIYVSTGGEPVVVEDVRVYLDPGRVTRESTPITVAVSLVNRTPFSVSVAGGSLSIYVAGLRLAEASIPAQVIEPGGNVVRVEVVIDNNLLDEVAYKHFASGEVSEVRVEGRVELALGPVTVPIPVSVSRTIESSVFPAVIEIGRDISLPAGGRISLETLRLEFNSVSSGAEGKRMLIDAYLKVRNESMVPVVVAKVAYSVSHVEAGVKAAEGEVEANVAIPPGGEAEVPFTIEVNLDGVPAMWYSHLRNGERSTVAVKVWPVFEAGGVRLELPEPPVAYERVVETSFFEKPGGGGQG